MTRDSDSHRPEGRAKSALEKALSSVQFFSTKAKAKFSTTLEERLHEPEPTPRQSVEVSSSQVDEAVLDTIDDVEASLKELRAMNLAAKSVAVPPINCGHAAKNRKPSFILSPKLTSTSPEEQVQHAKSESAARKQWHQQRRRQQEQQQQQAAALDAHSGTRQKLRRGSQEHPSSYPPGAPVHGDSSSSLANVEFHRLSEMDARGDTLEQQCALGATAGGLHPSCSLEQHEGAAGATSRRGSLEQREGARAARRKSSMESQRGPMSRKSCPLLRFEDAPPASLAPDYAPPGPCDASISTPVPAAKGCLKEGAQVHQHHEPPPPLKPRFRQRSSLPEYQMQNAPLAPPLDQATPTPCDASNTAPLSNAKGVWKGVARTQQLQQHPPPYVPPLRRRSSLPEYLMQGTSPVDIGQQPFILPPPEPRSSATNNCMLPHSSSGPLPFDKGVGRPLPRRFSQLQLRTDLSTPPSSLSPSSPMTAPNALASNSPSSSGPLSGTLASRSRHTSVALTPTGSSTQHHRITHSKSSGLLSAMHSANSTNASEQAAGIEEPLRARDASVAPAQPPVKGRFMLATQSSINRAEGPLAKSESAKKRSSQTGHRLCRSTSSSRRRVKKNPSSRSRSTQGSGTGKRARSTDRRKGMRSQSSFTRKGSPSKTSSQSSLVSSTSRYSSMRSRDSGRGRTSSVDGSDSGSDTPSVGSEVSSVNPAPAGAPSEDFVPGQPLETLPDINGTASTETNNKGAPLQPSMPGSEVVPAQPAHFAGLPAAKRTISYEHASSVSSSTSATSFPPAAAAPRTGAATVDTPGVVVSSAEGPCCSMPASKSAPRRCAPTKQASNVRFNLPAVAPPRSPCPPEEAAPASHSGRTIAIPGASKSKSSPTTAASSPKDPAPPAPGSSPPSQAPSDRPPIPAITALAKDALAEVPSTHGKISKQTGNLRQYLAGNRLDVGRLDFDTYLIKLDNENRTRSRSVGRFAGNKKQGRSKSSNEQTLLQQRGVRAGEEDSPEENGASGPATEQATGSRMASMFAQLGQEEQELQELHERMRTAANRPRAQGSGPDQRSLWKG